MDLEDLHEFDKEFLDELSQKAAHDHHLQTALYVLSELNSALYENRPISSNFRSMLNMLLTAYGSQEVDVIRVTAGVRKRPNI